MKIIFGFIFIVFLSGCQNLDMMWVRDCQPVKDGNQDCHYKMKQEWDSQPPCIGGCTTGHPAHSEEHLVHGPSK